MEIVAGTKFALASLDKPVTLSEMSPVNPPAGVAVTVNVVASPGLIVREAGRIESENSAAGVTSAILATNAS